MELPHGLTEAQALEAIEKAVIMLAAGFAFGYFSCEDMQQQARLFGLQCLGRWDGKRPIANFVYAHIRNRLINLRRDKLRRTDAPCKKCHGGSPCDDGHFCDKYQAWRNRNSAKANIMRPVDLTFISDEHESNTRAESTICADVETAELVMLIDRQLPVDLRAAFLQMRAGVGLPKSKRDEVERAVREIMCRQRNQDE